MIVFDPKQLDNKIFFFKQQNKTKTQTNLDKVIYILARYIFSIFLKIKFMT